MKLKIKVKYLNRNCVIEEFSKGDWIDLKSSVTLNVSAPQAGTLKKHKVNGETMSHRDVAYNTYLIPLGVAMQLPKGFEALVVPRSSTYGKFGITQTNSIGIIDNSYCGNKDEWQFPAVALKDAVIEEGERICQFRVQLSQKATLWQKLKWLFYSGVKFVEVDNLKTVNRGGFGSTGTK